MAEWGPGVVCTLDAEKAARLRAKTMLMPSPQQVQDVILTIPVGKAMTVRELRTRLAEQTEAEMTCPVAAKLCWRIVAEAAEEEIADGQANDVPWWRLTRDGKPEARLPGGADRHRALLREEGVEI